ncbi:MAG TPA: type 1 glutamine amidotransferase [Anaerolineae bacterium]|nr:type 1 glutamine amidotransferase [Anaerolineae bacterium]HIQ05269.1 type 1 glutamine amidotransferase [Anaerolineae bacterium]
MLLKDKKVAVLVEEGFEDLEFWVTVMMLQAEGAQVIAVSNREGQLCHGRHGLTATSDIAAVNVTADELDGIVVPGGWAPDKLRRRPPITNLVRELYEQGKPIGMICHGGQVGISAKIVKGHVMTGSYGIKDDLINAGAIWTEERAVRDRNIISAHGVEDIPPFCRMVIDALVER